MTRNWRRWAEEHNLVFNPETGYVKTMKDLNEADTDYYWLYGNTSPSVVFPRIWKTVRANVLKLMGKKVKGR